MTIKHELENQDEKTNTKIMAAASFCALVLICADTMPVQAADTETEYAVSKEKDYSYDSSTKKYTWNSTTTYKYNKKGRLTEQTTKYQSGYVGSYKCTYNKAGNIVSERNYANGKLVGTEKYTYDKKGRVKTRKYYDANGECSSSCTYKYSKDGKKGTGTFSDGTKWKYTYYSNGNIKTIKYYQNGELYGDVKYNKYGFQTLSRLYTTCENSEEYLDLHVSQSSEDMYTAFKKNKIASNVTETVYTYSDSKKGSLKSKTTRTFFIMKQAKR